MFDEFLAFQHLDESKHLKGIGGAVASNEFGCDALIGITMSALILDC